MLFIISLIDALFRLYSLILLVRILSSWVPEAKEYRIMQFIGYYTDPYLELFRKFIPPLGMIDFSPIIAFLALNMAQNLVINLLVYLAK